MTLEDQLRQSLQSKADSVHPNPDALEEIQARLDGVVVADAVVIPMQADRPMVRYVALAAAGLIAVGTLGYYSQRRSVTELDVAIPTTAQTTTIPAVDTTPQETEPPVVTTVPPLPQPVVVGPVGATKSEAGANFLSLIGNTSPVSFAETEAGVSVMRPGDPTPIVNLNVAQTEGGWAVTGATSVGITTYVEPDPVADANAIVVSGEGRGFEANLGIRMISALDGLLLESTYTTGGMPEPAPYATSLSTVGSELAWIVVSGDGGGEDVLQEFAAVPVSFTGAVDPRDFAVFRIPRSDRDEGLNLRSSPGADENSVLATLPAGTKGVRRTSSMPVLVGDAVWREVAAPDGQTGWAHSRYLTPGAPDVADDLLLAVGHQFAQAAIQDTHWLFPTLPWSDRVPIAFAWIGDIDNDAFRFDYDDFVDAGVWGPDAVRTWTVPEATFGQPTIESTHWDFLSIPKNGQYEVAVGDGNYAYEFERSIVESYLPNLRSVVISDINPTGTWSAVHLFVEPSPAGAQIVAIAVSHQVP
jgi:hypothetical protein